MNKLIASLAVSSTLLAAGFASAAEPAAAPVQPKPAVTATAPAATTAPTAVTAPVAPTAKTEPTATTPKTAPTAKKVTHRKHRVAKTAPTTDGTATKQ